MPQRFSAIGQIKSPSLLLLITQGYVRLVANRHAPLAEPLEYIANAQLSASD